MPRPSRRRAEFDQARIYDYPSHLREAIEGFPAAPGVYIFHGEEGGLPLYIGKSIHLRNRVLSHLRTVKEASMLRQTRRISHIRTAGEIGALLLEAQLIKQQHPIYNQKLRRSRQLCSLQVEDGIPKVVYAKDVDFALASNLYGLFASHHAALEGLRGVADELKLCYVELGLEKLAPGRPCFRAMIRHCAGVCRGDESHQDHRSRLFTGLADLAVATWPYPGAVGLVECFADDTQIHVVRNWCYLGSATTLEQARTLDKVAAGFDADGYKILCKPILGGTAEIVRLD